MHHSFILSTLSAVVTASYVPVVESHMNGNQESVIFHLYSFELARLSNIFVDPHSITSSRFAINVRFSLSISNICY